MISFLIYLAKVNIVFILLYVIYYLFFKRLTFHNLNRGYLMLIIPISFVFPLMELSYAMPMVVQQIVPEFDEFIPTGVAQTKAALVESHSINYNLLFIVLYVLVSLIFVWKLVLSSIKILHIKRKSEMQKIGLFWVVKADVPTVFSYFKWIFVPKKLEQEYNSAVIEHEQVHARMWHTLDLMIIEMFIALFWFNPFVFFFRKSLKSVHEYQVDTQIAGKKVTKVHYLQLMAENLESNYRLSSVCNYFNGRTIQNRVKMITKNKSSRIKLISYALVVPVMAILLQSFSVKSVKLENKPAMEVLFDVFSMDAIQEEVKPSIKPVRDEDLIKISSGYGMRIHPITKKKKMHKGVDFVAKMGTPVIATADGRIIKKTFEQEGKGYGRYIAIQHDNVYVSVYTQLSKFNVEVGDVVKQGDVIGYVGSSGISTGPHLHYEVHKNGERVNPADYF
jgi:beta-lactamase regulating signal transducer with metallopeptidase domain